MRLPAAALTLERGLSVGIFGVMFDRLCFVFEAKRERTIVLIVSLGDKLTPLP